MPGPWSPERRAAASAAAKARWAASHVSGERVGGKVGTDAPLQTATPPQPRKKVGDEFLEQRAAEKMEQGKERHDPNEVLPYAYEQMPEPDPDKPETIPPNYMSGQVRRLEDHNPRPGYVRYYQNDDRGGSSIAYMLKTGWRFVDRKDSQLNAAVTPRNNDLGSRVRQVVGTDEAGQPMYAYLMEKPEWLYKLHNEGPGSREEYHRQLERQIGMGTLGEKQGENRYSQSKPFRGQATSLPPISMDTSLKTHR